MLGQNIACVAGGFVGERMSEKEFHELPAALSHAHSPTKLPATQARQNCPSVISQIPLVIHKFILKNALAKIRGISEINLPRGRANHDDVTQGRIQEFLIGGLGGSKLYSVC